MFKVVTKDLHSLGLRKNPNIIRYRTDGWNTLPREAIRKGNGDYGGIWVVSRLSNARKLKEYMYDKYRKETRIFKVLIGDILYSNSYRLKTDKVKFLEEIILR